MGSADGEMRARERVAAPSSGRVGTTQRASEKEVSKNKGLRKQFFSEEKNQKTFVL
jgi:hypothetical protein